MLWFNNYYGYKNIISDDLKASISIGEIGCNVFGEL